ncbi:MAG TPA: DNA-3-methyladenine glycosylase [Armatimonadetes bacterium]|nr:DNA-3-methyladenine glycosylase [Armatimonadota bacterium]
MKWRGEPWGLAPVGRDFYAGDTLEVARSLLGKVLVRLLPEGPAGGIIVETEAYLEGDPANHAFKGRTKRNAPMFGPPGHAYVYKIHNCHCLNVVTRPEGVAEAVLIRAIQPAFGTEFMLRRRKVKRFEELTSGPGRLCQSLDIDLSLNGHDLTRPPLFIAEGAKIDGSLIATAPRVGVIANRDKPWRFYVKGNPFVSKR